MSRIGKVIHEELTVKKFKAYASLGRYKNQTGTKLLFWPCAWGLALGIPSTLMIPTLIGGMGVFLFGAFNLRSMGCAVNDYLDKDFDRQVERTMMRPLASGELNETDAMKFIALHAAGGLTTLAMMKHVAIAQSLGVFPLAMIYPLAKRYTSYSQVVLGLCFNSGLFIGFSQAAGYGLFGPLLPFYFGGVMWTVMYDTVYALQDVKDDEKLKLNGLARLWGKRTIIHAKRANFAMLLSFLYGGFLFDLNFFFHLGVVANYMRNHSWIQSIRFKDPKSFQAYFVINARMGFAIFMIILAGRIGASNEYQTRGVESKTKGETEERDGSK